MTEMARGHARIPIWEVDCRIIDLVLLGTFDWQELHNLLSARHPDAELPCESARVPVADLIVKRVHDLCHRDTDVSRAVAARLDRLHADAIAAVAAQEIVALGEQWMLGEIRPRPDLAGLAWALFTDPRPGLAPLRPTILLRMQYAWLRSFQQASQPSPQTPREGVAS